MYKLDNGGMTMQKIRIGIVGYGNLGKSAELGIRQNKDMELVGIFTRRDPDSILPVTPGIKTYMIEESKDMAGQIDVMLLCGGSSTDLPVQGPEMAGLFHTVDGFDTHAKIPEYYDTIDRAAKAAKKVSIICSGWDPGMFSLNRLYADAILPEGKDYTFWGRGVSQGHSDAIRRVKGVIDARQYTIPIESAIERVRMGETPDFTARDKHKRECYVVAEEGADLSRIEREIKEMPYYFNEYDTTVHFITLEELEREHSTMPHGGFVFRNGRTGEDLRNSHIIEYRLKLDSNPDFTANVLIAYARAAFRLGQEGACGARTVFDIAPAYISMKSGEELRQQFL